MRQALVFIVACGVAVASGVGCGQRATTPAATQLENRDTIAATETGEREVGPVHCFSWVHLDDFSTDCFRTAATCEQERLDMQAGARDVTPACEERQTSSCTEVGREIPDDERCFGDLGNCERYRAYVTGNGLVTTACTTP